MAPEPVTERIEPATNVVEGPRSLSFVLWGLAALMLGLVWSYPHILHRIREGSGAYAQMEADCDPSMGACRATFPDGRWVALAVETSTNPRNRKFLFRVEADPGAPPRAVDLTATNMNLGLFRVPVHPASSGPGWSASTYLPLCTMSTMRWRAEVVFDDRVAAFTFESERT